MLPIISSVAGLAIFRSLPGILIAVIVLIVYGSLYPWHFVARELPANPIWMLFHSWGGSLDRRGISDIIVNIAIYIPLGMSAHLAFRRYRVPLVALWGPVLLGGALSASIEMTQLFVPGRICSALDLLDNIVGSALGAAAGIAFEGIAPSILGAIAFVTRRPADRSARVLVFIWIASLLFPLFPVTSLYVLRDKLAMFLDANWLDPVAITSAALSWFAAGRLLNAAGFHRVQESLVALLLVLPAQILIVTLQPTPAVVAGAAIGAVAFCIWGESRAIKRPLGWIFPGLLLVRGLVPFHLLAAPQDFTWIPFGGSLESTWQTGIQILIGKAFYYGTAIWLLRAGGMRMRNATMLVALVLASIEAAQRYLPGRTPEVTDPIMAILLGSGLWAMRTVRPK